MVEGSGIPLRKKWFGSRLMQRDFILLFLITVVTVMVIFISEKDCIPSYRFCILVKGSY